MTKIAGQYGEQGTHMTTEYDAWPLIPEEVANEIQTGVAQGSAALNLFERLPNMSSRTYRMPVMSALGSAAFVNATTNDSLTVGTDQQVDDARMLALKGVPYGNGDPGVVPEEGAPGIKTTAQLAWENVFIVAEPIAILLPVPDDVIEDSSYDIWAAIKPKIIDAFNAAIDGAAIWGQGRPTTWPSGIVPTAISRGQVVTEGTGADLGIDISNLMGVLEEQGFDPTGFIGAPSVKAALRNIRATDGSFIFSAGNLQDRTPDAIFGLPVSYVKNGSFRSTISRLICGAMGDAKYSIRSDMQWKLFDQGVITDATGKVTLNLMTQDTKVMRVVMRLGWAVPNPASLLNPDRGGYPFSVMLT
jgi:HK97 family phage major capsid protein